MRDNLLGFIRIQISRIYKLILKFKQLEPDKFILIQEFIFVVCLHELEVLLPQTVNARLEVYLDISHLVCSLDYFVHGNLKIADAIRSLLKYCLFGCLPREQSCKVLLKFLMCFKPIENVMSWNKVEEASIHRSLIIQRFLGFDTAIISLVKHFVQLVEEFLDELRIFITNLADPPRRVAHMEMVKVLFIFEGCLYVRGKCLHSPGDIKLTGRVIIIWTWEVTPSSQSVFQLLQRV